MNEVNKRKRQTIAVRFTGILLFVAIVSAVIAGITPPSIPTTPAGIKQMQSVYVMMKDGTRIAVRVILPPDLGKTERIPAIIETTPYRTELKPTFLLNLILTLSGDAKANLKGSREFLKEGYALVKVDARGSGASFGTREMVWSDAEIKDTYEVINWVAKQSWSNGNVGTYGISYSGNTAELAVSLHHPGLKAAAPLYADFEPMAHSIMPGGILNQYLVDNFYKAMSIEDANEDKGLFFNGVAPVDDDKGEQLLQQALRKRNNVNLAEAFGRLTYFDDKLSDDDTAYSLAPFRAKDDICKSGVPFYVRVGWMDAGTVNGAIERYLTYDNRQLLVIGPWNHGGLQWYDPFLQQDVPERSLEKQQVKDVVAFFDHFMKGTGQNPPTKEIRYYTMGEGVWKTTKEWPVAGFTETPFYFHPDGGMKRNPPKQRTGFNSYTVDFSATTGTENRWRTNLGAGAIVYPNRSEEDKKLLTYTSNFLEHDIEITGTPVVTLHVSSSTTDGVYFVYLEAVAPDGKVTYLTEGQLRALHRKESSRDLGRVILGPGHSYRRADGREMVPGEVATLRIGLFATSVLIKKGYRLRIALAGHDASNFERIPETAVPAIELQTNRRFASSLSLPVKIR